MLGARWANHAVGRTESATTSPAGRGAGDGLAGTCIASDASAGSGADWLSRCASLRITGARRVGALNSPTTVAAGTDAMSAGDMEDGDLLRSIAEDGAFAAADVREGIAAGRVGVVCASDASADASARLAAIGAAAGGAAVGAASAAALPSAIGSSKDGAAATANSEGAGGAGAAAGRATAGANGGAGAGSDLAAPAGASAGEGRAGCAYAGADAGADAVEDAGASMGACTTIEDAAGASISCAIGSGGWPESVVA